MSLIVCGGAGARGAQRGAARRSAAERGQAARREQRRDHREDERRAHELGAGAHAEVDFSMYLFSTRWNCSHMPITSSCRMAILRW